MYALPIIVMLVCTILVAIMVAQTIATWKPKTPFLGKDNIGPQGEK